MVLAGLVSSCYVPMFTIEVSLDRTDLVLTYQPPVVGKTTLTATLNPSTIRSGATGIMWETSNGTVVDFVEPPPTIIGANENTSTVMIMAWSPGEAVISIRIGAGGSLLEADSRIVVEGEGWQ